MRRCFQCSHQWAREKTEATGDWKFPHPSWSEGGVKVTEPIWVLCAPSCYLVCICLSSDNGGIAWILTNQDNDARGSPKVVFLYIHKHEDKFSYTALEIILNLNLSPKVMHYWSFHCMHRKRATCAIIWKWKGRSRGPRKRICIWKGCLQKTNIYTGIHTKNLQLYEN